MAIVALADTVVTACVTFWTVRLHEVSGPAAFWLPGMKSLKKKKQHDVEIGMLRDYCITQLVELADIANTR